MCQNRSALSEMMSVLSCEMTDALAAERVDSSATAASRLCTGNTKHVSNGNTVRQPQQLLRASVLAQVNPLRHISCRHQLSTRHHALCGLTCTCSSDSLSTPDAWHAATPRPESPERQEPLERALALLRLLQRPDERLLPRLLWPAGRSGPR